MRCGGGLAVVLLWSWWAWPAWEGYGQLKAAALAGSSPGRRHARTCPHRQGHGALSPLGAIPCFAKPTRRRRRTGTPQATARQPGPAAGGRRPGGLPVRPPARGRAAGSRRDSRGVVGHKQDRTERLWTRCWRIRGRTRTSGCGRPVPWRLLPPTILAGKKSATTWRQCWSSRSRLKLHQWADALTTGSRLLPMPMPDWRSSWTRKANPMLPRTPRSLWQRSRPMSAWPWWGWARARGCGRC